MRSSSLFLALAALAAGTSAMPHGSGLSPRRCKAKHHGDVAPVSPVAWTTSVAWSAAPTVSPVGQPSPAETATSDAAPSENASSWTVSEAAAASETPAAPSGAAPSENASSDAAASEAAPSLAVSSEAVPSEAASSEAAPSEATPSEAVSSEATVSEAVPSDAAPSEATPTEATPSEAAPSEATPSEPSAPNAEPLLSLAVGEAASSPDEILALHNDLRASYGASPLEWDEGLAQSSSAWASQCVWEHSGTGENLAAGSFGSYTLGDLFELWADEVRWFDWAAPQYQGLWDGEKHAAVGHFTQAVWKDTTRVGCAWAHCAAGTIQSDASLMLVCQYDPDGNIVTVPDGQSDPSFVANVGPAA